MVNWDRVLSAMSDHFYSQIWIVFTFNLSVKAQADLKEENWDFMIDLVTSKKMGST